MRSTEDVHRVFELWNQDWSKNAISKETGVSRAQILAWVDAGLDAVLESPMRSRAAACDSTTCTLVERVGEYPYSYLLGQYLGDGCISTHPRGVYKLRIATCDMYPEIRDECELAMALVMPGRKVGRVQGIGCTEIWCFSKHWPCLFPQHGAGAKHKRRMVLEPWQEHIALVRHPKELLRGLIHSDGWRGVNTVKSRRDPDEALQLFALSVLEPVR